MRNRFSLTTLETWLREKAFRILFVLFLSAALFLLYPGIYENAYPGAVAILLFGAAIVSFGTLRLLCRRWPDFLQFSNDVPFLKAGLFFVIFLPVCFIVLALLFGWLGWLDEQSWARPPHPTQVGMHAWFVGMWYGFWWTPLGALLLSWILCRHPRL